MTFVLGLVLVVGVPSFLAQLSNQRLETAGQNIANLMVQTRQRAIRDNTSFKVDVVGTSVRGMGVLGPTELELDGPEASLYADPACYNFGFGSVAPQFQAGFYGTEVSYLPTGIAEGPGAVCITDGSGNILQIGLDSVAGLPKLRKFLPTAHAPAGKEGFYEKTGFDPTNQTANLWVWF